METISPNNNQMQSSGLLSTTHISPEREPQDHTKVPGAYIWLGGGLVSAKVPRPGQGGAVGGGKRGAITKFSRASRLRLMRKVAKTRNDHLPIFVTLTYGKKYPTDPKEWKKHLQAFYKRLTRRYPHISMIWKLEPQKRGAPHWHLLVWNVPYLHALKLVPKIWYEIAGYGDDLVLQFHQGNLGNEPCVGQVRSYRGVMAYASKYLGKELEVDGWQAPGRFWGVMNPEYVPWGELIKIEDDKQTIYKLIRIMRKYARLKGRSYSSLSVFADGNFWFDNYHRLVGGY